MAPKGGAVIAIPPIVVCLRGKGEPGFDDDVVLRLCNESMNVSYPLPPFASEQCLAGPGDWLVGWLAAGQTWVG